MAIEQEDKEAEAGSNTQVAEETEYQATPRRWAVLTVMALSTINACLIYGTLTPIAIPLADAFELPTVIYINWTILVQVFMPVPMTFVSVYAFSQFKTDTVLRCASSCMLLGATLRALCFFYPVYWLVAAGQMVSSICNVFLANAQLIIANRWFTDKERATATVLQLIASPLGTGVSFGVVGGWFANVSDDDPQAYLDAFRNLCVLQFFITLGIFILFQCIIKDRPDTPPSSVATVEPEKLSCVESLREIRSNCNFSTLLVAFSLPFGSFLAVGSLLSNVFTPFGFTGSQVAYLSLALLTSGVVGAVVFGALLDRFKLYKVLMGLCAGAVTVATALLMGNMYWVPNSMFIKVISLIIGGVFGTGYFPLCFAYSAELTFPTQYSLIDGTMNIFGGIAAFLFGLLGTWLVAERDSDADLDEFELIRVQQIRGIHIVSLMSISCFLAFIINFFIKEDLRRLNYAKDEANKEKELKDVRHDEKPEEKQDEPAPEAEKADNDSAEIESQSNNIQDQPAHSPEKEKWVEDNFN